MVVGFGVATMLAGLLTVGFVLRMVTTSDWVATPPLMSVTVKVPVIVVPTVYVLFKGRRLLELRRLP